MSEKTPEPLSSAHVGTSWYTAHICIFKHTKSCTTPKVLTQRRVNHFSYVYVYVCMHVRMYRYMCMYMHFACIGTCVYADVHVCACMCVRRVLMLASGVTLIHSLVYVFRQSLPPNLELAVPTDLTSECALGGSCPCLHGTQFQVDHHTSSLHGGQ